MKQLLGLATLFAVARAYHESPPPWSPTYTVSGYLTIPFAEINEKFDAYYDEESGSSRIDYYDGMDKTYQLSKNGDFGKMLKIVPMTDETVFNQINCFESLGSQSEPVEVINYIFMYVPEISIGIRVSSLLTLHFQIVYIKGHLISNCLFGVIKFFQKTNENKSN